MRTGFKVKVASCFQEVKSEASVKRKMPSKVEPDLKANKQHPAEEPLKNKQKKHL